MDLHLLKDTIKTDPISIRLSIAHMEKIQKIQCDLNVSRNKIIDMLLDSALADLETQYDYL